MGLLSGFLLILSFSALSHAAYWKLHITNFSANAVADWPYVNYSFSLLPGIVTPPATCTAAILQPHHTQRPNHPRLLSFDDVHCNVTQNYSVGGTFEYHTGVAFRYWQHPDDNGGYIHLETNMSFENAHSFRTKRSDQDEDPLPPANDTSIFFWQQTAFSIEPSQVKDGGIYTGPTDLEALVQRCFACNGSNSCVPSTSWRPPS